MKFLLIAAMLTAAPIWRQGSVRDMNLWQWIAYNNQAGYEPFGNPHIPYSEALTRAQEAWCCRSITRRY